MRIVPFVGAVLDMGRRDRDSSCFLLGCLVNLVVILEFCSTFLGEIFSDGLSQPTSSA